MINDLFSLKGKTALVTGASSGIGQHFALTLARAGADVVLAARRVDNCQQTAEEITALGRRATAVALDVTNSDNVKAVVAAASDELGPITILCNNAGIVVTKPFLEQQDEDWDSVLDTNLRGAYLVAQAVAKHMAEHAQGGSIINTVSMYSFRVAKQLSGYVTSKAALMQLTRAMAVELAVHNIRVNAIAPGYILTDFNRDFFASDAGKALIKRIPQRQVGEIKDLDGALLLLASEAGRYMTGSAICVDGGHSINPV